MEDVSSAVRVSLGSYKLFYEAGMEDALYRRRSDAELALLEGKAKARREEMGRWKSLFLPA
jgi:paired amphipathic helix protein Sin3a